MCALLRGHVISILDHFSLKLSICAYLSHKSVYANFHHSRGISPLEKSYFRCKNTCYVECNYILQPPKYLIIVVSRLRYINNIQMDMNVVLGVHKLSLQATISQIICKYVSLPFVYVDCVHRQKCQHWFTFTLLRTWIVMWIMYNCIECDNKESLNQKKNKHRSSRTIYVFWPLYCLYQLLQKHSIVTTAKLRSLKWLITNTHLLLMW